MDPYGPCRIPDSGGSRARHHVACRAANVMRVDRGVDTSDALLDRTAIEPALRRLAERLSGRGVVADLYVYGGAAMTLLYDPRRATREVDAVFEPYAEVIEEAREVALGLGLPAAWLTNGTAGFVAPGGDPKARRIIEQPGVRVSVASPEHLLAMKVLAARRRDAQDIERLVGHFGIRSVDEVLARCSQVFPDTEIPSRVYLILEDVLDRS